MEPEFLEIEPPTPTAVRKARRFLALLFAALWVVLGFPINLLLHRALDGSHDWLGSLASTSFSAALTGLFIYFMPPESTYPTFFKSKKAFAPSLRHSIRVDYDHIAFCSWNTETMSWVEAYRIRREHIRSVFWIMNGIGVSERSTFSARMLGYLPVPQTLPKFEELQTVLKSWQEETTASRRSVSN